MDCEGLCLDINRDMLYRLLMNGAALAKTILIHCLGLSLAQLPGDRRFWQIDPAPAEAYAPGPAPALYLVSEHHGPPFGGEDAEDDWLLRETGCPRQRRVDVDATPDFPLFGPGRPFRDITPAPYSPAYCVRIGTDGRVREVRLADGSGNRASDRALARQIRQLHFAPAQRAGAAVAAWHRLIVNLPNSLPDRRDGLNEAVAEPLPVL